MYSTKDQYGLPDDVTWTSAAKASATAKNPKDLFDVVEAYGDEAAKAGKFPVSFYTHMICAAAQVDAQLGWDLYTKSKQNNVNGGVQHYHLIIQNFLRVKGHDVIPFLYEDMKAKGVLPDESTYYLIVTGLARIGKYEKIYEVLQEMRDRKMTPTQQMYSAIFDSLSRTGDFKGSLKILEQMKQDGLKPALNMWTNLMFTLGKAAQYERAVQTLSDLKDPHMDNISYKTLLHTLVKIRLGEYSSNTLDEMKNTGMQFDENLKNVMLLLGEEDDGSNLDAVLAQMAAAGVTPDEPIFNILMDQAVRKRNIDQVRAIMGKMEQYHVKPSNVTWNIYMRGLGMAGLIDELMQVWETKFETKTRSLIDYNAILHQMVRNGKLDIVARIFNEMNTSGIEPTEVTANILMTGYGKARQLDRCVDIFNAFKRKYGSLSAVAYNTLMGCCLMNKRPDRAIELMDKMKAEGVQPLSYLGWDVASEGITRMNRLEQSWDTVQKQPSGIPAYCDLIQLCIECNRPDLVQRVINITHQSDTLKWQDVEHELPEKAKEKLKEWEKEEKLSMTATVEMDNLAAELNKPGVSTSRRPQRGPSAAQATQQEPNEPKLEDVPEFDNSKIRWGHEKPEPAQSGTEAATSSSTEAAKSETEPAKSGNEGEAKPASETEKTDPKAENNPTTGS